MLIQLSQEPLAQDLDDLLEVKRREYRSAVPFPHCHIDGLFSDELLDKVVAEFPSAGSPSWELREVGAKSKKKLITSSQRELGPYTKYLFGLLSSPQLLRFTEEVTGIRGLISDPYFHGGGLHEIQRGGLLELHSDFNWHGHLHMFRRLNLLLYLNRDWKEEYEGALELWDSRLERSTKYYPIWNRLIIQQVTSDALHGFPAEVRCPEGMTRRSMAMWYYTAELPVLVQNGYDMCEPDFIERTDRPQPLPRPLWRRIFPPVVHAFVKKKKQTKSFSPREVLSAITRFVPPILIQALGRRNPR